MEVNMPAARAHGASVLRRHLRLVPVVACALVVATTSAPSAADPNPIVVENQQAGTTSWQFTDYNKSEAHEIEGYASLTSVNKGGSINFMVSTSTNAQYNLDIYRMGWYPTGTNPDGTSCAPSCGGRLMRHVGPLSGFRQAGCPTVTSSTDPNYGLIECNWTPSYTLAVPTNWTQGVYLVKLTRLDGTQLQNYMTFVVRDDSSTAPVLYSLDTNTWQAYNFWGGSGNNNLGINLYGRFNDVTLANVNGSRAYTVSFDRPYMVQGEIDGAGNFFVWDFPMVKWMESHGYDMTYVTDTELQSNPNLLLGHRVMVNTGHDEYYSDGMRSALQNGIAGGTNLAFFSANNIYSKITWSANGSGAPLRRIHTSKGALNDGTVEYRYLTPPQPENAILGVLQNGVATSRPYLVYDANSWMYAGTGLVTYVGNGQTNVITGGAGQNALAGMIGYEFDERAVNAASLSSYVQYDPPGVQQVGHSFVPASDNGVNAWSDATLYTAPSGATVFSAGTIQWSFAVDNGFNTGFCSCDHNVASTIGRRITSNILDRFSAPSQAPSASLSPSSLGFGSRNVGTTSPPQTVTLTNTGAAAMTISSIGVTGANAGDFAQTNTCPVSPSTLAAGANCTISVTFTPTGAGARAANLSVADDAPGSPQTVALSGTGVAAAPAVSLSPTSLAFGQQPVGTSSASQNVTLTNTGTAALTISSIGLTGTNSGDYAQTNTCPISPATLGVGANCTISVTFSPTAAGIPHGQRQHHRQRAWSSAHRRTDRHGHEACGHAHPDEPRLRHAARGHVERGPELDLAEHRQRPARHLQHRAHRRQRRRLRPAQRLPSQPEHAGGRGELHDLGHLQPYRGRLAHGQRDDQRQRAGSSARGPPLRNRRSGGARRELLADEPRLRQPARRHDKRRSGRDADQFGDCGAHDQLDRRHGCERRRLRADEHVPAQPEHARGRRQLHDLGRPLRPSASWRSHRRHLRRGRRAGQPADGRAQRDRYRTGRRPHALERRLREPAHRRDEPGAGCDPDEHGLRSADDQLDRPHRDELGRLCADEHVPARPEHSRCGRQLHDLDHLHAERGWEPHGKRQRRG